MNKTHVGLITPLDMNENVSKCKPRACLWEVRHTTGNGVLARHTRACAVTREAEMGGDLEYRLASL